MVIDLSGYTNITLSTCDNTHLWYDSIFMIERAVECEKANDSWHAGTYTRASTILSVAALESSCSWLFSITDENGGKEPNRGFSNGIGLLEGIKREIEKLNENNNQPCTVNINLESTYWKRVQKELYKRNGYAHGRANQINLFPDYRAAAKTGAILLEALEIIYDIIERPLDKWIEECLNKFKSLCE